MQNVMNLINYESFKKSSAYLQNMKDKSNLS